jgi:putative glutathione S-transferase
MGQVVDGVWQVESLEVRSGEGRFVRAETQFRDVISADGGSGFKAEAGRYHLYVSLACPWAHRTLIFRVLKGLEEAISVSVVDPFMAEGGWEFGHSEGCIADPLFNARHMHNIYTQARQDYSGRASVPVLWDRQRGTIVNNESAEIIRMMNTAFAAFAPDSPDYCPEGLRGEIDEINERVYTDINNGVYRTGFATTQDSYEEAFGQLFEALDWVEDRLRSRRYLCGAQLTEADWRLFVTLVRFDCVYVGHFKCNLRRISDYPCLSNYLRELYQMPGIAGTCNFRHIKEHYYRSHESINPTRIVPRGPEMNLRQAHDRDRL